MQVPNIPHLLGVGIGKVIHAPVDIVCGIKKGVTGLGCGETAKPEDTTKYPKIKL